MKPCIQCGSHAINNNLHGRDGSDSDLCDVCYWRKRAIASDAEITALMEAKTPVTCQIYGHVVGACSECNTHAEQDVNETNKVLADNYIKIYPEIAWVRDVLASQGYDGPLAQGCCPLENWLKEREQLREQVEMLQVAAKEQVAKDRLISYERCPDCDYESKCSRITGCLGIKDHSPIMNKALAATEQP